MRAPSKPCLLCSVAPALSHPKPQPAWGALGSLTRPHSQSPLSLVCLLRGSPEVVGALTREPHSTGTSPGPGRTRGPRKSPSTGRPLPPPPGRRVTGAHTQRKLLRQHLSWDHAWNWGGRAGRPTHLLRKEVGLASAPSPRGGGGGWTSPHPFLSLELPGRVDPSPLLRTPTALSSL